MSDARATSPPLPSSRAGAPERSAPAERFEDWAQTWTLRFFVILAIVYGGIGLVVLWPLDLVSIASPSQRDAFATLRATNAVVSITPLLALSAPLVRRTIRYWAGPWLLVVTALGAWHASALPHDPFYWPGVFAPIAAAILFVGLPARIAWCLAIGLVHNLAWYAHSPSAWDDASTAPSLAVFFTCTVFGIGVGHATTEFARRTYDAQRESARQRAELATWNERLVREVDAKTREVRRLAERAQHLLEDERRRLAAELHDELGQSLTALRLEAAVLAREGPSPTTSARLDERIDEMFDAVRFTVSSLRPRAIDAGLPAACEWLVERHAGREDVDLRAAIDDVDVVDDARRLTIFRVLQESMTNAIRHAEAREIRVSLSRRGESVVLEVDDDGVGFDVDAPSSGHGLESMRERASAIGAVLELTRKEKGTRVRLVVPPEPAP